MSCKHVSSADLHTPGPTQSVYREDCTQCFDSVDQPGGLNVCLSCFNGGCVSEHNHAILHHESTSHPLTLNIKRKRKYISRDEPPQKISKLAIAAETEEDKYDVQTRVDCYACKVQDVDKSLGKLPQMIDAVLKANTFARQEEVKAWEQEITPCEHTLRLEQDVARNIESNELGHCAKCDLKENLWLCLTCGNLGCGRQQYGGAGGNGHGLAHTEEAGHPVAVKLGSLTADGQADIYCYACNEERTDPEIKAHLVHFGINLADRIKTEKSLTELQIEQNLRWEFSMTTGDGQYMKPLFGPGFTGLKNLGNSCYLASVLQCLFSFPEFAQRYYHPGQTPLSVPRPAEDLETQLRKLADGLLSGRYSHPDIDAFVSQDNTEVPHQKGLTPAMLKHLIGKGHPEFSTMRQQDAYELLLHLFQIISRSQHTTGTPDPIDAFRFVMEQRLQCIGCKKVKYRTDEMDNISVRVPVRRFAKKDTTPNSITHGSSDGTETIPNGTSSKDMEKEEFDTVTLTECLDIFTSAEHVELTCSSCSSTAGFTKRSLFKTLPALLALNTLRFDTVVNWVPTKLDIPVIVGDKPINFDAYMSHGLQAGEQLLLEETTPKFVPNEFALSQLEAMGFPLVRCTKALKATGNSDAEAAMTWLFEHMEDPDIDMPDTEPSSSTAVNIDPSQISDLKNMGFSAPQARQALKETGGSVERAVDWLFSHPDAVGDFVGETAPVQHSASSEQVAEKKLPGFEGGGRMALQSIVCHKGTSIHSGHYVAFIRKRLTDSEETGWVLFNDEKVAQAADVEEMKKFAYIYFFRRV